MQILITGAAGFIGFNLSKYLLENTKLKVLGVDNLNNYYSRTLKLDRIKDLKKFKNFTFKKIDITNKKKLNYSLYKKKISLIINLAAQAGVRYSLLKPTEFVENNILGFYNILNFAKKHNIKKILYASSSSVYGDSNSFPLNEKQNIKPKNIYALSKKINEEMANVFSSQFKISLIGLRFFTVYGEWGRPDMFIIKLLNSISKKKKFYLNKSGNHDRDFTYINDVSNICFKLIKYKPKKFNTIFNVCSGKKVNIKFLAKKLKKRYQGAKIVNIKANKADVKITMGDNSFLKKEIKYKKFNQINLGLEKLIDWYNKYKIYKII